MQYTPHTQREEERENTLSEMVGLMNIFFFKSSAHYVVINWCVNENASTLWHSMRLHKTTSIFMPFSLSALLTHTWFAFDRRTFISLPAMSVIYIEWRRLTICRIIHFNAFECFEKRKNMCVRLIGLDFCVRYMLYRCEYIANTFIQRFKYAYENSFENKVVWIIYLFVVSDYTHHTVQSISVQWAQKKTYTYIRFIKEVPLTTLAIHIHSICSGFCKSFAAWQFHFVKLGFEYGITNYYKSKSIKICGWLAATGFIHLEYFWIAYCIEKVQLYQIGRKIKLNWKLKRFSYSFGCKNKTVRFFVESLGLTAWLCEPYAVRKHNLIRIIYACKVLLSHNLSSNMVICCVVAMSLWFVFRLWRHIVLQVFFLLAPYKLLGLMTKIFNGNFHGALQKFLEIIEQLINRCFVTDLNEFINLELQLSWYWIIDFQKKSI